MSTGAGCCRWWKHSWQRMPTRGFPPPSGWGGERSPQKVCEEAAAVEPALIDERRHAAPGREKGEASLLHLRHATQRLKDAGRAYALPEKLWRILRSLSTDGRSEDGGVGSVRLRRLEAEPIEVKHQREWSALAKTAQLRRAAAERLLGHLHSRLPQRLRGA